MYKTIATALALLAAPLATSVEAAPVHDQAGPYELQVLVDGVPAATFNQRGESYVLGHRGARYTLRVSNHSSRRIEAVVSVDGRDVIDGRNGDYQHKRGYLVPAYGQVEVDGWRLNGNQAAAFRFSSVAGSYASRTGSARDVGVIGVAVFPERYEPQYRVYVPSPRPRPYWSERDDYAADESAPPPPAKSESRAKAAAPSSPSGDASGGAMAQRESPSQRPGLGTGFGERVDSPTQEVPFIRQSPYSPSTMLGVRYNDRSGLLAMGIDVDGNGSFFEDEVHKRRTANPFPNSQQRYATPPPGWDDRWY